MKDFKIYIIIASALLIGYLVMQYNRPKPVDWRETFVNTDKIPYGTYILYHQLHDIFPNAGVQSFREPVYNVINDHAIQKGTYIIISKDIDLKEYDYEKLIQFINKGNDVLIAANSFGGEFNKKLKIKTSSQFSVDNHPGSLRFLNKALDTTKVYSTDKNLGDSYFSKLDTARAAILGDDNHQHINLVKYTFNKGHLFLSTTPLMFTNYSLLQKQGAAYTSTLLSHLNNSPKLIWDEYYTLEKDSDQTPLRVFLKNDALCAAFYIAFFSLLIFVVYEMKRRQRIIPVIDPLNNTTVDFVNVVGQVYYEQRNNSNIAQKKVSYFLEHIRTKYFLKTTLLNEEFVTTLSQKTGVKISLIQELVNQATLVRTGLHVSDHDLIELNKNIEQFYIQSR